MTIFSRESRVRLRSRANLRAAGLSSWRRGCACAVLIVWSGVWAAGCGSGSVWRPDTGQADTTSDLAADVQADSGDTWQSPSDAPSDGHDASHDVADVTGPRDVADSVVPMDTLVAVPDTADTIDAVDTTPPPWGPAPYPTGPTHSPVTPYVVAQWDAIAARGSGLRDTVFMKVGDSISASTAYLNCFAGSAVDLGNFALLAPTLATFNQTSVGAGATSFDRTSAAVEIGRTASWVVSGAPSPVQVETSALSPRFAMVMYGTNDIGWFAADHANTLRWYSDAMITLLEGLMSQGIIPIVSSIPPRDDSVSHDRWVETFNHAMRAVAQAHQIPYVDYHRELMPLPSHGLGGDGIHPNASPSGACVLSTAGLQYGYNVRNRLMLEALHRANGALVNRDTPPDAVVTALAGTGGLADPWVISALPFVHESDTRQSSERNFQTYGGCGSSANEGGPERVYRLELSQSTALRAVVIDKAGDIDIHLLDASATEGGCIARGHTVVEASLAAGTYYLVLDTFVGGAGELPGEYYLAVLACEAGDPDCQ